MAINADRELIALYNLKTKRQKRRALKEDREKQLLRLYEQSKELYEAQRNLPMVPLNEPFQKDWKRTFAMHKSDLYGDKVDFYQCLLDKINTAQYSRDKQFRDPLHRKKNGQKLYRIHDQSIKEFEAYEWNDPKLLFTDKERELFQRVEYWHTIFRQQRVKYVFTEPWRYKLIVTANIIYEVREEDGILKQMESELDNYLRRANLWNAIYKVRDGSVYNWKREMPEKAKYRNPFKNKPFTAMLDEVKNE